jgi:hypothetical protein
MKQIVTRDYLINITEGATCVYVEILKNNIKVAQITLP